MAVETGPSIVVVGGDLAGIALWGFHGGLVPELCVSSLGACHLRLGPILHWGMRSWCSIAEASWFLKAILLAGLAFHKLAFVFLSFFDFGPFSENGLVHQGVEVQVDLRVSRVRSSGFNPFLNMSCFFSSSSTSSGAYRDSSMN